MPPSVPPLRYRFCAPSQEDALVAKNLRLERVKCEPSSRGRRGGEYTGRARGTGARPCPSCLGLRTIAYRNRDTAAYCPDCRRGEVVTRETYRARTLQR